MHPPHLAAASTATPASAKLSAAAATSDRLPRQPAPQRALWSCVQVMLLNLTWRSSSFSLVGAPLSGSTLMRWIVTQSEPPELSW